MPHPTSRPAMSGIGLLVSVILGGCCGPSASRTLPLLGSYEIWSHFRTVFPGTRQTERIVWVLFSLFSFVYWRAGLFLRQQATLCHAECLYVTLMACPKLCLWRTARAAKGVSPETRQWRLVKDQGYAEAPLEQIFSGTDLPPKPH